MPAPLPAAHGLPLLSARALPAQHAPEVHHDVRKCSETRYPQEGESITIYTYICVLLALISPEEEEWDWG